MQQRNQRAFVAVGLMLLLSSTTAAEDWPGFRGPTGQGLSSESDLPLRWSGTENITWRAAIPGEGWSSPIVFGDRVFVTTATEGGVSCRILCLDRRTGEVLWNREVHRQKLSRKEGNNSFATPTPTTDGQRVYAVFSDGCILAVDYSGQLIWKNHEVVYYSQHGLGNSPRLVGDLLVMPFDGSSPGVDKEVGWQTPWDQAVLLAVELQTGKVRWRGRRGLSRIAHTTPVVVQVDGKLVLLSNAGDVVQAFDPQTGSRLWSVASEGEGVVPSLVTGQGLVFAASGFPHKILRAFQLREPMLAWEHRQAVPTIPSPVYAEPYLFTVSDAGIAQCLEAATGRRVWQERLGGKFSASPVLAAGRIYLLSESGETTILEAAGQFKVLARNSLEGTYKASPAVSRGQLFLRSDQHLYCIGPPKP